MSCLVDVSINSFLCLFSINIKDIVSLQPINDGEKRDFNCSVIHSYLLLQDILQYSTEYTY